MENSETIKMALELFKKETMKTLGIPYEETQKEEINEKEQPL